MHDCLSIKSVTECFHVVNKTPMMWYSKKQATSETATYGSEFIACRTCCEKIVDRRNSFRYLGVPVFQISYMFGDNKAQITSSTVPQAKLNKRHNILSFHFVRDTISKGFIELVHIASEFNAADILTKHWSYQASYPNILRPFLFYSGNVGNLYDNDEIDESTLAYDTIPNVTLDANEKIEMNIVEVGNY